VSAVPRGSRRKDRGRLVNNIGVLQHIHGCQSGGARGGMTRIRQAVCKLATMPQKHVCDFVANQTTAQRHVTIGLPPWRT
jgi:hypothetical protein